MPSKATVLLYMCMDVLPALLCACVLEFVLVCSLIAIELACVKLNLILIRVSPREIVYVIFTHVYICMSSWRRRRLGGRRKKRTD